MLLLIQDLAASHTPADEISIFEDVEAISASLKALGHQPSVERISLNLEDARRRILLHQPDLVMNLVDSIELKGHLIHLAPALLETMKLPYTGCRMDATYLSSHKLLAKHLLQLEGLPTAPWHEASALPDELDDRYIVKSVWEHASIGIAPENVVHNVSIAKKIIAERTAQYGGEWFIERYIHGREFNISILDGAVLPHAEIRFEDFPEDVPHIIDHAAKWDENCFSYQHTVRHFDFPESDRALLTKLSEYCLKCWSIFNLSGYARVDFRVDVQGNPWILEVNSNPCISPDAGLAAAAERAGMDYTALIARIVDAALP
ncbi:MAG: D-alanine--D-alanine ligase [Alphaproteobacteria bacterium]|nr:D-alanine--D-alanine ligase [Alphaproteobacteria bacterium]